MDATDLQAARKAAAERFYAVGMAALPAGWTYKFRKALSGRAFLESKRIESPKPVTRKSLYIWLHECAHAHLHAGDRIGKAKRHVEEFEAEQWAHAKMREAGIPVPRTMTKRAKAYVARKITQATRRGAKHIDPNARRFAAKPNNGEPKMSTPAAPVTPEVLAVVKRLQRRLNSPVKIRSSTGPRGVTLWEVEAECTAIIGVGPTPEKAARQFISNMGLAD